MPGDAGDRCALEQEIMTTGNTRFRLTVEDRHAFDRIVAGFIRDARPDALRFAQVQGRMANAIRAKVYTGEVLADLSRMVDASLQRLKKAGTIKLTRYRVPTSNGGGAPGWMWVKPPPA